MSRSLSMPEHNILIEKVGHVKGKDVNGNIVTLERTHPRQLALFQTFVSDEDRYSNTIELYDAVPKYFSHSIGLSGNQWSLGWQGTLTPDFLYLSDVWLRNLSENCANKINTLEVYHEIRWNLTISICLEPSNRL